MLIEKLCLSKIRLVQKKRFLASKQGLSLSRLMNNSCLRYMKLQCYEQQNSKVAKRVVLVPVDDFFAMTLRELVELHISSVLHPSEQ